jgi:DNA helicase IV
VPVSGDELAREQAYVATLYARLDAMRERTAEQLEQVRRQGTSGTHQARYERDAFAALHTDRLAQLWAVEHGLCFGRLDLTDHARRYIGRIGLSDDEHNTLLVDWRAPAAQPFYRATPGSPEGVSRRRHLYTRGREVIGLDDDLLDLDALSAADRSTLNGEAALLAAVSASRTGRMSDIVATIQSEQDRVIRSDLSGVLVVQGGPGTGKTAVALHRAAYLLYTHRERLARRGILVVGPNPTFLRYIGQVLPSLGETGVVLSTVAELYPGVSATGHEPVEVATIKGDARMAQVLAAAVRDRERAPTGDVEIVVDRQTLRLDRRTCETARRRARRSRKPHNAARPIFVRAVLAALAEQVADRLGRTDLDPQDRAEIAADLREEPAVAAVLDDLWPELTPQRLLSELFASPAMLYVAGADLTDEERGLLVRPRWTVRPDEPAGGWTPADVPLLDEAAELLGQDEEPFAVAGRRAAERQRWELAYAEGVLEILDLHGLLDPALLAERQAEPGELLTTAERAAADRTWAFGHVIVDEAQELSEMAWRTLMRRCPSRSMTVVGDLAQTGSPWGARSWASVLDPHAAGRWRVEELTVNYRTPAEIMAVAGELLATINPTIEPPASVREAGEEPWALRVEAADLAASLRTAIRREADAVADGRLAVLLPASLAADLGAALARELPGVALGSSPNALDSTTVVLAVDQAKGLEFDSVLVVEPAQILAGGPQGGSDLYVALTRATQRLGVLHAGPLPEPLGRLRVLEEFPAVSAKSA